VLLGGVTAEGKRLLSEASVVAMQSVCAAIPEFAAPGSARSSVTPPGCRPADPSSIPMDPPWPARAFGRPGAFGWLAAAGTPGH